MTEQTHSKVEYERDEKHYPAEDTTGGTAFDVETITVRAIEDADRPEYGVTIAAKAFCGENDHVSVNVHAQYQTNKQVQVFDLYEDHGTFSIAVGKVSLFLDEATFRDLQDKIRNPQ